jgi:hypothetical protein
MRFLVIVKATKDSEAGNYSREAIEEMGKFNEGLVKDGIVLAMDGLHPSSKGTRLRFGEAGRPSPTARSPKRRSWSPASGSCSASRARKSSSASPTLRSSEASLRSASCWS